MAQSDKQRALAVFMASQQKKYGNEGAKLGNAIVEGDVDIISTGSALLDDATGIGGLPRGRTIEIFGEEGSGKTSLCTIICANALAKYPDEFIGWIDIEHALNWKYAQQLGMKKDHVVFDQPSSGEHALETMLGMVSSGAFSVVVLDSVGAIRTKRQLEKEMDEATMGEVARLLGENVTKINDAAKKTNTLVIWINQMRTNIGAYGAPPTTMGGKALKFFASMRIDVKKYKPLINKTKDIIGQEQKYTIKKNRLGVPFKEVETEFYFGRGFNVFKEVIDLSIEKGLIKQGGAWFYPNPSDKAFKFQGKDGLIEYYSNDNTAFESLRVRLKTLIEDGVIEELNDNVEAINGKDEAVAA